MRNSSDSIIDCLNTLSPILNRYLSMGILFFGIIGNSLNCLVLSQRTLRSNSCALLFLTSSIANIITLISGLSVRFLAGWHFDLTDTVGWLCKFRIFVLFSFRTMASWLILLATLDRWLSSSPHVYRRQMSNIKNAQRGAGLVICLSSLAYAQVFYCYEANVENTPLRCYGKTVWCQLLIEFEFTSISVVIPSLLMFVLGFLTLLNIRQISLRRIHSGNLVANTVNKTSRSIKRIDRHLLLMLCIQVVLLTLFSLPQTIANLYSNITRSRMQSALQNAIVNFIVNLFLLLTYVTNGMPFYIYTLIGETIFRKALFTMFGNLMTIRMTHRQRQPSGKK